MTRFPSLPASFPTLGSAPARRRLPAALSPEEEQSLLVKYGAPILGGLVKVGHVLGTPASIVQGLAAGEPERAFEGIFDPSKRVYGREMLEKWGVLGPNKPGLDVGDVLGVGAGIALDPLFWVSGMFSGLGAAGRAAKASGLIKNLPKLVGRRAALIQETPASLLERILDPAARKTAETAFLKAASKQVGRSAATAPQLLQKPLGGLLNLGPLGAPWVTVGTGKTGEAIAKGLDVVGETIGRASPSRALKMLFSPEAMGLVRPLAQKLAKAVYPTERAAQAAAEMTMGPIIRDMSTLTDDMAELYGHSLVGAAAPTVNPSVGFGVGDVVYAADRANYGYVRELGNNTAKVFFQSPSGGRATVDLPLNLLEPAFAAGTPEATLLARATTTDTVERLVQYLAEMPGDVDEAFRLIAPGVKPTPEIAARLAQMAETMKAANNQLHADLKLMGVPIGTVENTNLFNFMTRQGGRPVQAAFQAAKQSGKQLIGQRGFGAMMSRRDELRYVPTEILNRMAAEAGRKGSPLLDPKKGAAFLESRFGKWLNLGGQYDSPAEHAAALADYMRNLPESVRESGELLSTAVGKATRDYLRGGTAVRENAAQIMSFLQANLSAGEKAVALPKVFDDLGWNTQAALQWFGTQTMKTKANPTGIFAQEAANLAVDAEAAEAVVAVYKKLTTPEWGGQIGYALDRMNKVAGQHFTLPFPGFHSRNFTGGQGATMLSDIIGGLRDIPRYLKRFGEAFRYWRKPSSIPPELMDEIRASDIASMGTTYMGVERVGAAADVPRRPWAIGEMFREAMAEIGAGRKLAGRAPPGAGAKLQAAHQTLLGAGSRTSAFVEWMNRVTPWLFLRKDKGWDFLAAADKVRAVQLDYSALSPFERTAMKRWMLFYSFLRRSSQMVVEQIAERPGGALSQTIQAGARTYAPGTFVPPHVARGTAIPRPPGPGGGRRFITGLGLMHEDPLSAFGGSVRDFGEQVLGRTAPWFKIPAERIMNRSFFFGRPLDDLDPAIQRIIANVRGIEGDVPVLPPWARSSAKELEFLASGLPTARYISTLRTATDPRKGPGAKFFNIFTGLKITDVSEAQESRLKREALERRLRSIPGAGEFTQTYLTEESIQQLGPKEAQMARDVKALLQLQASQARNIKKRGLLNLPAGIP